MVNDKEMILQTTAEIMARLIELGYTYSSVETTAANILLAKGAMFEIDKSIYVPYTRANYEFENKGRKINLKVYYKVYGGGLRAAENIFRIELVGFNGVDPDSISQNMISPSHNPKRFKLAIGESEWNTFETKLIERLADWETYATRVVINNENARTKFIAEHGTDEERAEKAKQEKEQQNRERVAFNEQVKQRIFEKTGLTRHRKREMIFEIACNIRHASKHLYKIDDYTEKQLITIIKKMLLVM
jgi:hypothetical protein